MRLAERRVDRKKDCSGRHGDTGQEATDVPHGRRITSIEIPCKWCHAEARRSDLLSSVSLDQGEDLITSVSLSPRVTEKFVDTRHHRAALRCANHAYATTPCEVEQPFIAQDVQSTNHRVLVHPEHCCQVDRRGKAFALSGLAFGDGSSNFCGHLFVEVDWLVLVDFRYLHRTTLDSTITMIGSKEVR
jgi:hypothetical protein